ncbi:MAG: ImmA/IrrE family metallo-endopeptidase [Pelolinea sp.]|nr:ImmA/IrrE family metallo-endopeptidase [Pelolinea sp.]
MITKMIRTEKDYQDALEHLNVLMDSAPGSPEEDELELLSFLVEKYEEEHFPIDLPDPVEAIKFRMEQQGLTRKDLVQYIGSQSKVSEVLNRKRPLSLAMIRALHKGLGIPADVLLQDSGKRLDERRYNPEEYPLKDMVSDGYFPEYKSLKSFKEHAEELLEQLLSPLDSLKEQMVLCRSAGIKPLSGGAAPAVSNGHAVYAASIEDQTGEIEKSQEATFKMDEKSLRVWQARMLQICETQNLPRYSGSIMTEEFIQSLVRLSVFSNGPLLAEKVLLDSGIHFVILPHLPKTYLDGACFKTASGRPVIGMTLRHDRLDNFWFTLAHELSHALLHLQNDHLAFFDDMEHVLRHACNEQEVEANRLSMDLLIPDEIWEAEKETIAATMDKHALIVFARELGISPAIVAGRLRWESGNFAIYNDLLGSKTVKRMFTEE